MAEYLTRYKEFPKDKWEILETISGEPTVKQTKISDYTFKDLEYGDDVSEEKLNAEGYSLMMVCYMLKGEAEKKMRTVIDSTFTIDTITMMENGIELTQIVKNVTGTESREEEYYDMIWEEDYLDKFREKIIPLSNAAEAANIPIYGVIGKADKKTLMDFVMDSGVKMPLYTADDILLKTIVRSNPGIVLWKDGVVVKKWHINKLPSFEEINRVYVN
jgi:hypothetical protein